MSTWKSDLREVWMHTDIEVWHQVILDGITYPYLVSSNGDVMNMNGKVLSKIKRGQRKGTYHYVNLYLQDGSGKHIRKDVQRIVAEIFIDNPDNKPEVNHLWGDHFDNRARNLEWCTRSENEQHKRFMMAHREFEDEPESVIVTEEELEQERREYEEKIGASNYEEVVCG